MIDDHRLAADLAARAGSLLVALRRELNDAEPGHLRREGDRRSQVLLDRELRQLRPGDAILSEEAADDPARLEADRVWIVDPLDGTREFSEPPREDWAVHVALWEKGELVAGAVALPGRQRIVSTLDLPARPEGSLRRRMVVSRTRPPALVESLAGHLDAELVPMGSAGAKAMAVVLGEAEMYIHAGGQYEWDSAAPVAVATAAGFHASRIDGSPLRYNQADPLLPDLLICHPELADEVLSAVPSCL